MKFLLTTFFVMIYFWAFAQSIQPDTKLLDKDPVFRKVLKRRLTYPIVNELNAYTKLVYAQFSIDEKGHVQDVKVINPSCGIRNHDANFDKVVEKTLKRLPPLNPSYLGKYVLPILFAINGVDSKQVIPDNINSDNRLSNNVLLTSVTVLGYSYRGNNGTSEPGKEFYNTSKQ